MLVTKSILKADFKPLQAGNKIREALDLLEDHKIQTLPVVDKTTQKLIGQVHAHQLFEAGDDALISDLEIDEMVKIYEGHHIFEAARLLILYELTVLPMVDKDLTFLGVVTKDQVFEHISQMLNVAQDGSIITIELDPIDFSISEIVQIIETEGAKILGLAVEGPREERSNFEVSIKLNMKDISRVTAALKRYDYTILIESESTVFGDDLEHRADELLKYIDM